MNRSLLAVIILWLCASIDVRTAPLSFVPQTLVQPNGDTICVFASGDEYNNWLHDKDGYTIVRHPSTGYYTFAVRSTSEGGIGASQFIVGVSDPRREGLEPHLNVAPAVMEGRRRAETRGAEPPGAETHSADKPAARSLQRTPSAATGLMNNIVIFIRFADDVEFITPLSKYRDMFNSPPPAISLAGYFDEVSYHTLHVSTTFYPAPAGDAIISYQDPYPRAYYRPYNSLTNPIGYRTDDSTLERKVREHTMLRAAIHRASADIPSGLLIDADNDGKVDNVTFIVNGFPEVWNTLLWPHKASLWNFVVELNGKKVWTYNLVFESVTLGTLCHEFYHSLGANDMYRYPNLSTQSNILPLGTWDIMCGHGVTPPHMSAYMKHQYGMWIPDVPEITANGTYTLSSVGTSKQSCYKVRSKNSKKDYYFLEYRRREGLYESTLPGEGLLVYRAHLPLEGRGNYTGPPDELYLYRPGGTVSSPGDQTQAALSAESGRKELNSWSTNPVVFLSDRTAGDLLVYDVGRIGDTINFSVCFGDDSLYAGAVDKSVGTIDDTYKFSVSYHGYRAPGSVSLHAAGKTYPMAPTDTRWSDGVRFTKTISFSDTGAIPFSFSAVVEDQILTYPHGSFPLSVVVTLSNVGADLAATTLTISKGRILYGDRFLARAVVRNAGRTSLSQVPYRFSLCDPNETVVGERSGVIDTIGPGASVVIVSNDDFPAPAIDGHYELVFSMAPPGDVKLSNNTITRTFYVGSSLISSQYVVPTEHVKIRMDSIGVEKLIGGTILKMEAIRGDSIVMQMKNSPPVAIGRLDFAWNDKQKTIVICDDISGGGASLSIGSQTVPPIVTYDRMAGNCNVGQVVQFTASIRGSYFTGLSPDMYKNPTVAGWPITHQLMPGDSVAKISIVIPPDAPMGTHQFYLSWAVGADMTPVVQALQFTVRGVWTHVEGDGAAVLPEKFSLSQNYPNPFNPSTTIRYSLPARSAVTLKVFDPLGRHIVTLINAIEDAGNKVVTFNARGLPSGMYFYRLEAGEFTSIRKLVIVK